MNKIKKALHNIFV